MPISNEIDSVAIAGPGNVGIHLAEAFHKAGVKITHLFSREPEKVVDLATRYHCELLKYGDDIFSSPDLILLCVPDNAVHEVGKHFYDTKSILAHVSGSTDINVLKTSGSGAGVFYPLQTFTKDIPVDFEEIPFCIEGSDSQIEQMLIRLASRLSKRVFTVDSNQRKALHVSAVFACNFTNHLALISQELLRKSGLDFKMLRPLLEQTYKKLQSSSPDESQTGPAIRGDQTTILDHLEFLKEYPEEKELYKLLSENIKRYGERKK